MAHGYPDWHRGSILEGLRNGVATGVNMDDLGNLVALLKGVYNNVPTVLACDKDGNINVNVQVLSASTPVSPADASTIFKTSEQTPLTEIKIKSAAGATNIPVTESAPLTEIKIKSAAGATNIPVTESAPLTEIKIKSSAGAGTIPTQEQNPLTQIKILPADSAPTFKTQEQAPLTEIKIKSSAGAANIPVAIQSFPSTVINNFPKYGSIVSNAANNVCLQDTLKTLLDVTGKGQLVWFHQQLGDDITPYSWSLYLEIDGVLDYFASTWQHMVRSYNNPGHLYFKCSQFLPDYPLFWFSLAKPVFFYTSLKVKAVHNRAASITTSDYWGYYLT